MSWRWSGGQVCGIRSTPCSRPTTEGIHPPHGVGRAGQVKDRLQVKKWKVMNIERNEGSIKLFKSALQMEQNSSHSNKNVTESSLHCLVTLNPVISRMHIAHCNHVIKVLEWWSHVQSNGIIMCDSTVPILKSCE